MMALNSNTTFVKVKFLAENNKFIACDSNTTFVKVKLNNNMLFLDGLGFKYNIC